MNPRPQPFVALWLFLLFPFWLFAQDVDELVQKLNLADSDQTKIDLLVDLSQRLSQTNPDTVMVLSRQAHELSRQSGNYRLYDAVRLIALAYDYSNRFDSALLYYNESLALATAAQAQESMAMAMTGRANIFQMRGQLDSALHLNRNLLNTYKLLGKQFSLASTNYNISIILMYQGKYDQSREYLSKQLEILNGLELTKNVQGRMAAAYVMIGANYGYEGDYARASEMTLKAKEIYDVINDKAGLAQCLSTLGQINTILHDEEKALVYYKESVSLEEELKYPVYLQNTYRAMAQLYENMGELDLAIYYSKKSFNYKSGLNQTLLSLTSGASLPILYARQNKPDSAQYYYDQVLPLIKETNMANNGSLIWQNLGRYNFFRESFNEAERQFLIALKTKGNYSIGEKMDLNEGLYKTYSALGDYKKALNYLENFKQLSDSIFSEEQIREVTELEAAFEHNKELLVKENEIALLTVRKEVANLRLTIGIVSFVVLTLGLVYLFRRNIKRKEQKARELEEISQFKEAMTGMIAHDLKNPLSLVLNSNSENDKVKQAAGQMLQLVTNMLDVHKFESAKVKVSKEDLNISDLLHSVKKQVYHLLSQKNLTFNIMSEQGFSVSADGDLLERVFINLLTNAIKYSPINGTITVQVLECDGQFCISVSDEGPGIPADQLKGIFNAFTQLQARKSGGVASTGLGLTFCKLALEAHGSQIEVASALGSGTTFSFKLEPAKGEVIAEIEEVTNPLMQALELIKKEEMAPQILQLQKVKLYQVGEIRKILMEVKNGAKENKEAVELWVDSVLNAAYQGNDQEYDRLVEALA